MNVYGRIDLRRVWDTAFSVSFVQQWMEEGRRTGSPGSGIDIAERIAEEASAVADVAVDEARRLNAEQDQKDTAALASLKSEGR